MPKSILKKPTCDHANCFPNKALPATPVGAANPPKPFKPSSAWKK